MIITILPSSKDFHAVAYNEKKVEKGMAELIEIKNFNHIDASVGYDASDLQDYLLAYSARNENIVKSQFHVAVSCKGTEYTHQQLLEIAHRYLEERDMRKKASLYLSMPTTIHRTTTSTS